ncbi:hypothetical protein ACHAW6_009081 [Cyclotella cf. meneghiniana]
MPRRTLLLPAIAATAAASNSPLHLLQSEDLSALPPRPRRTRRRPEISPNHPSRTARHRLLSTDANPSSSTNATVSNDFSLLLNISSLLPASAQAAMEGTELDLSPRIINGDAATPDRYPYTASLVSSSRHVCGGTLIAPDVILTAGHCSGFFSEVQIDRYDITADDGDYDYLMVEEHFAHPDFANIIQSDFALAKLYGRSFKSVVALNTDGDVPQDDEYLTVMGWGVTVEGVSSTQSDILREVQVQSMGNTECDGSSGQYNGEFVTYEGYIEDNMLCAWSQDKDACQGDSGGPLIRRGDDAADDVQVGVVSWGLGCAMETFPGVYSRISAEYEWIRSSVCEISKFPPTSFGCDAAAEVSGQKQVVTLVVELDGSAQDTSWVLDADDRGDFVEGTSYAPFGTYNSDDSVAVETLSVTPGQSYRFTVMDRNGGGSARSSSRFRICYGSMSSSQCLSDDDAVICGATGILSSVRSVTCLVEANTPSPAGGQTSVSVLVPATDGRLPTFSPFFVPLFFETRQPLSDDSPAPSPALTTYAPTVSPPPEGAKGSEQTQSKSPSSTPKKQDPKTPSTVESQESSRSESSTVANAEASSSSSLRHRGTLRQSLFTCVAVFILFV